MIPFTLSFDPKSLSEIAQFAGFPVYLSAEVQQSMKEGGDLLVEAARAHMNWKNPTGALEESIHPILPSPYEVQVGSDLPYARRREYGFSGKTDRLGRYYANDPGAFYMTNAMKQKRDEILRLVEQAMYRALPGGRP